MSLTRTLYRSRILQRMDATGSSRWDTTAGTGGEVDPVLSLVFDREWRRILSIAPYVRVSQKTPTSDSSGRYLLSDLQTTTGDSQERLFRILAVRIDSRTYQEADLREWAGALDNNPNRYIWWRQGDYIRTLPNTASKAADAFWVNHLPTRPDALSADSATVVFPDGYDDVVIHEAAAMLLAKGGAETDATSYLKGLAEEYRRDMLDDLSRIGGRPRSMAYGDLASDWGAA